MKIFDPTRPRLLDHRQAERFPWLFEALLTLAISVGVIAVFVIAIVSER